MRSARFLDDEITSFLQSYGWYTIILFVSWYMLKSYIYNGLNHVLSTKADDLKRKEILDEEMRRIRKLQYQNWNWRKLKVLRCITGKNRGNEDDNWSTFFVRQALVRLTVAYQLFLWQRLCALPPRLACESFLVSTGCCLTARFRRLFLWGNDFESKCLLGYVLLMEISM